MSKILDEAAIEVLFTKARSYNEWLDKDVSNEQIRRIYELTKYGPTSANCCPARFVFIRKDSDEEEKLLSCLAPGNVDKTKTAPITAIVAYDLEFYEHLPKLFPHNDAKSWFEGNEVLIQETSFRNATLQAAYLMMAVRSVGLDCGAMSGFDQQRVKDLFFKDEPHIYPDLLLNIGYGDPKGVFERLPRFNFEEVCKIV